MTIILWLAAVLLGSVLGIAFGRLAAQLPIAAVAQSVVAASAASIACPVIVFISTEVPMAVSLRMLPVAVVMSLRDNVISILIFALMIAGLHVALGLSTRLAPRRPILLGILGGLLGAVAVGPAIERLNVAPVPSRVQNRVSQTGVFDLGRSDQPRRAASLPKGPGVRSPIPRDRLSLPDPARWSEVVGCRVAPR